MYAGFREKYPKVILIIFKWRLNFVNGFSKNTQTWNFMKIRLVGAELLEVDRRTDGNDEAVGRFSQFFECS